MNNLLFIFSVETLNEKICDLQINSADSQMFIFFNVINFIRIHEFDLNEYINVFSRESYLCQKNAANTN